MRRLAVASLLLLSLPVSAGVFFAVDSGAIANFSIVHPPTFDGTGGTLMVRVCVDPGSEQLIEPLRQAIQVWNSLTPETGNCTGCAIVEEPDPTEGLVDQPWHGAAMAWCQAWREGRHGAKAQGEKAPRPAGEVAGGIAAATADRGEEKQEGVGMGAWRERAAPSR